MKVLVTGFGPFPGVTINVSETVLPALKSHAMSTSWMQIDTVVLPASYYRASLQIGRLLATGTWNMALLLGQGSASSAIELASAASNSISAQIPDTDGTRLGGELLGIGPAEVETGFNVERLAALGKENGINVVVTAGCGTYVCNSTFYTALLLSPTTCPVVFAHLPSLQAAKQPDGDNSSNQLVRDLTRLLELACDVLCNRAHG
ncbi:MAG: hypothetical protein ABL997_06655 [Planctomycetota bacterium]